MLDIYDILIIADRSIETSAKVSMMSIHTEQAVTFEQNSTSSSFNKFFNFIHQHFIYQIFNISIEKCL